MPKAKNTGLIRCTVRFLKELGPYAGKLVVSGVLLLFSSVLGIMNSFIMGRFTDSVLSGVQNMNMQLLYFLFVVLDMSLIANLLNQFYGGRLNQHISFGLREKMVKKINRIIYPWFEEHEAGDLITRLNTDLGQAIGFYSQLKSIGVSLFIGLLSLVGIIYIQPLLAVAYLLFPVIAQVFIYFSSRKLDPQFQKRQQLLGDVASCSQEALNGIFEIKAMQYEPIILRKYEKKVHTYITHVIHLDKACSKNDVILETINGLQNILLIIFGGLMVFGGKITMGDLLTAQILSGNINGAVSSLNFFQIRLSLVSVQRILEVWDAPEIATRLLPSQEISAANDRPIFRMNNVSFAYPQRPEVMALQDVNLSIYRGQKIAIVGPSGSGKSSILKLMAAFYTPNKGKIESNITEYSLIEQDTFLFADTFFHNIACGDIQALLTNREAMLERVVNAADTAELDDFIESLPKAYQAYCAEHGKNLSGGQRQRFSIARCVCRDAELLLLDEPTASLDPATEQAVMRNLLSVFQNKTLLLVTHNLQLVESFDYIYVLKDGHVAESGTHKELMNRQGLYCRLLQE